MGRWSMSHNDKKRKIVLLAAGAVVGLSATSIVLQQSPGTATGHLALTQPVVRDGTASTTAAKSEWMQLASNNVRNAGD